MQAGVIAVTPEPRSGGAGAAAGDAPAGRAVPIVIAAARGADAPRMTLRHREFPRDMWTSRSVGWASATGFVPPRSAGAWRRDTVPSAVHAWLEVRTWHIRITNHRFPTRVATELRTRDRAMAREPAG